MAVIVEVFIPKPAGSPDDTPITRGAADGLIELIFGDDGYLLRSEAASQQGRLDAPQAQGGNPRPLASPVVLRHQEAAEDRGRCGRRLAGRQHSVEQQPIVGGQRSIGRQNNRESIAHGQSTSSLHLLVQPIDQIVQVVKRQWIRRGSGAGGGRSDGLKAAALEA